MPSWMYPRLKSWRVLFVIALVAVLTLSLLPATTPLPSTGWDKTNHLLAFSVLALLGRRSFPGRIASVLLCLVAYGGLIEILQSFTPDRSAEWPDLLADSIGLMAGEACVRCIDAFTAYRSRTFK